MAGGAFPTLISIITMFLIGSSAAGFTKSFLCTVLLILIILLGIFLTLLSSKFLSRTFFKGHSSSFALELPPYRRPQFGKVIVRSIFDRTLFVLGRAVTVALPAGVIIWIFANVTVGDQTILAAVSGFLDPFARLLGLDGVILLAFVLGFPANEIVFPIIIMAYLSQGVMVEFSDLVQLKELLTANGWTVITAICMMVFSLCHFPCSTTLISIYKETKSVRCTLIGFLLPLCEGIILCFVINNVLKLFI